jgi:hypothetical protein
MCLYCPLLSQTGHVTDHVTLTQEHSKLYHYLSVFEGDTKRKLAMEQRRFDMLAPLLKALSKSSFEVLHKQVRASPVSVVAVFAVAANHTWLDVCLLVQLHSFVPLCGTALCELG